MHTKNYLLDYLNMVIVYVFIFLHTAFNLDKMIKF